MLKIADKTFQSRLFTGTGKFSNRMSWLKHWPPQVQSW